MFAGDATPAMLQLLPQLYARAAFPQRPDARRVRSRAILNAMAAATYLVHKGVPFRTAHEKIGNAVRFALEKGVELEELSLRNSEQFGEEFGEDFFDAITLDATLDCHDVIGGTARDRVRQALIEAKSARSRRIARGGRPCWCVRLCCRTPRMSTIW